MRSPGGLEVLPGRVVTEGTGFRPPVRGVRRQSSTKAARAILPTQQEFKLGLQAKISSVALLLIGAYELDCVDLVPSGTTLVARVTLTRSVLKAVLGNFTMK